MTSRVGKLLVVAAALTALGFPIKSAHAADAYWQGDVSSNWNTAGNWSVEGAGAGGFVPQVSGGFNLRAVIGTDNPEGALNSNAAPFGSPAISAALTPAAKTTVGGLYLGTRQRNFSTVPSTFVNPAPAAGALVGALTISDGTLNVASTGEANIGADGRILIGQDGRGYLTMTGGTLNGPSLIVAGEDITTNAGLPNELGPSLVDLRGASTLAISTATPSSGTMTFERRLRIEGPSVNLSASGSIRLNSTNSYTAVITSPTLHSPLKAPIVNIGGGLNVQFSGAGATHSLGQTWDLIDAGLGMIGNFNNLTAAGDVNVSGLAVQPPVGAAYRLQQADGPSNHKLLQLVYDSVLVLHVNRTSGVISITNPQSGDIEIDGYSVQSTLGSLKTTYKGLSGAPVGDPGWTKYGLLATNLSEVKQTGTFDLDNAPPISLGDGFNPKAVAANNANFGTDGEDVIFEYTSPGRGIVRGQVVYEGTKFENNLVLRVNPNNGHAYIKNDSNLDLKIDGFTILSSTNSLSGGSFTPISGAGTTGSWAISTPSAGALTQSNLTGETTLLKGEEKLVGNISSGALSDAAQAGLSMQFLLSAGLAASTAQGDYNSNGKVDAADYTIWRDHFGQTFQLANEGTGITPGTVSTEDYTLWKQNFGLSSAALPETAFRLGSVVFDTTAGSGSGGFESAPVPEPTTGLLLAMGLGGIFARRRKQQQRPDRAAAIHETSGLLGARHMSKQFHHGLAGALSFCAIMFAATSASAATQGIPLTNFDFELPGPPGAKVLAFDMAGGPVANAVPGWTFSGPGVEEFGHAGTKGDSGTEAAPPQDKRGQELFLSILDGNVSQTATGFSIVAIPATQVYKFGFHAHGFFNANAAGLGVDDASELTARLYYGASKTTLATIVARPLDDTGDTTTDTYFSATIASNSPALSAAIGQPIGIEFDSTSNIFNPAVVRSWIGIDNVVLEITGATAGDLNGDGAVDFADYAIVRDNQQTTSPFEFKGELTNDNKIDLNDFRAFKSFYAAAHPGSGSIDFSLVPEPSTMFLILIVALASVGLRSRRSQSMFDRYPQLLSLLVGVGLAAAASTATATELAYDPFCAAGQSGCSAPGYTGGLYTVGPIAGQGPNTGSFFGGPWTAPASGDAPNGAVLAAPGLSYLGTPALGGSAGIATPRPATGDTNARYSRPLAVPWISSTVGTYYISYVVNFGAMPADNLLGDMGYRGIEFTNLYVGYNSYYYPAGPDQINQKKPDTARMTLEIGPTGSDVYQIISNSPASFNQDGATHLVVLKFEMTTTPVVNGVGGDTISVFLDPITTQESNLPGASLTGLDYSLSNIGYGFYGSDGSTSPRFDEIRVGTTYADVLPELPTPGDTDGDHDVDLIDYATITSFLNQTVPGGPSMGDVALADGTQGSDGKVTLGDFRLWKDKYPFPSAGLGAFGPVPEPTSLLLVLIGGAAGLVGGRGRRQLPRVYPRPQRECSRKFGSCPK